MFSRSIKHAPATATSTSGRRRQHALEKHVIYLLSGEWSMCHNNHVKHSTLFTRLLSNKVHRYGITRTLLGIRDSPYSSRHECVFLKLQSHNTYLIPSHIGRWRRNFDERTRIILTTGTQTTGHARSSQSSDTCLFLTHREKYCSKT